MSGQSPEAILYDRDGSVLPVDNGVPYPSDTPTLIMGGSDGTNARYILVDSSGRQILVGVGTAGSQTGGILTIQGDPAGTPIPISGNITASNASVGANDAAIPGFSTLVGGSDGTNLRSFRIFDADTGGGTQWVLGVGLRKFAGGGSVELGTSSDPIRTDPTGSTTQPISGAVTVSSGTITVTQSTPSNLRAQLASEVTTGTAVPSTAVQMGGSDGTNLRPFFTDSSGRLIIIGAAANGAAVTGNPVLIAGSDGTNARSIRTATDGTVRVDPTGTTTQPVSGTVTANQGTANTLTNGWPVKVTDGVNTMPTGDVMARSVFNQLSDGTTGPVAVKGASTAPVAADKALVVVLSPNQPSIPVTTTTPNSTPDNTKGYITTAAVTTVPLCSTTYTEQSSNFTGSIASSNANDTAAGTGARTVRIFYVDATGATAGTEDAILNGTTGVNLVTSTKCFIEKIVVLTVGSAGSNAGTISLYTGANKTGTVVVSFLASDNQTFCAHHYVVSGKTCNISGMTGFNNNSSNQTVFILRAQVLPIINQAAVQVSDWVTGGLTFQVIRLYDQLIKVPGPAVVRMYVTPGGTPNIISRGSFDYYDA